MTGQEERKGGQEFPNFKKLTTLLNRQKNPRVLLGMLTSVIEPLGDGVDDDRQET